MLSVILGDIETSYYSLAYETMFITTMLSALIMQVIFPNLAKQNKLTLKVKFTRNILSLGVIYLIFYSLILLLSENLLILIYGYTFQYSIKLFNLLLPVP